MAPGDVTLLLRALLAGALGFAVGWEREAHGHSAGVRTVSIVALSAAALTTLSEFSFPASADRILANIIVSVGFLGAGMILRGRSGEARGLTTAASVWGITIVGMVVGLGHYLVGVILTGLILLLLWWQYIPWLARLLPHPPSHPGAAQLQRPPSSALLDQSHQSDDHDSRPPDGQQAPETTRRPS